MDKDKVHYCERFLELLVDLEVQCQQSCNFFFFRLLYAIAKIAIITARIILHLISYPRFTYDLFHMHHSPSYLSREHVNPKLTCSQRQWLHSSVGRASHRYREVTGSSSIEVLNFFQASLHNCKNCDHNGEDHSSFDLKSCNCTLQKVRYVALNLINAFLIRL